MTAAAKKTTVKADIGRNRLVFTITGWLTKKDLDNLYTDVRFCVADLKPGFHVITDLSACTLASLIGIATYRRIMNYLLEKEVGQVVRITRHPSLIHKQILNLSTRMQGYRPVYVETMAEAERLLAGSDADQELEFFLPETVVRFRADTAHETGHLRGISTRRCTVETVTTVLAVGQSLVLELEFPDQNGPGLSLTLPARVLTVEKDHAVAEFTDLTDNQRCELRAGLARAARASP